MSHNEWVNFNENDVQVAVRDAYNHEQISSSRVISGEREATYRHLKSMENFPVIDNYLSAVTWA